MLDRCTCLAIMFTRVQSSLTHEAIHNFKTPSALNLRVASIQRRPYYDLSAVKVHRETVQKEQ